MVVLLECISVTNRWKVLHIAKLHCQNDKKTFKTVNFENSKAHFGDLPNSLVMDLRLTEFGIPDSLKVFFNFLVFLCSKRCIVAFCPPLAFLNSSYNLITSLVIPEISILLLPKIKNREWNIFNFSKSKGSRFPKNSRIFNHNFFPNFISKNFIEGFFKFNLFLY